VYNVGLRRVDEFLALLFVSATDDHVARCRRLSDLRVDVAQFIFTARWSFRVVLLQPPRSLCRRPAAADKLIILRIQARNQPSDNGGGACPHILDLFRGSKIGVRSGCLRKHRFLSVQCYATLSANSPTGQTPQRIFTVDSLKDADLRKDVPFGGLDDE